MQKGLLHREYGMDWLLYGACLLLATIGMLLQLSCYARGIVDGSDIVMQMIAMILGMGLSFLLSRLDYHLVLKWCTIFAAVAIGLVLLLKVPGLAFMPEGSDDLAWIQIGGLSMQPSEVLKLAFIYTFSLHLSKVQGSIHQIKTFLLLCLHGLAPILLIANTGDLGSALVFFFVVIVMMFAANLSRKWLLIGAGVLVVLTPFVWQMLPGYLKQRFEVAWRPELDPNGMGYQQLQGKIALSSGGVTGKGLFNDVDLVTVPETSNDFIFAYLGQTLGLVGCLTVILLLVVLLCRLLLVAGAAVDEEGSYICVGVFGMLLAQAVINIGMVLCAMPVVGLTLPFISSGGTSLVVCFAGVGMALGVSGYRRKRHQKNCNRKEERV